MCACVSETGCDLEEALHSVVLFYFIYLLCFLERDGFEGGKWEKCAYTVLYTLDLLNEHT